MDTIFKDEEGRLLCECKDYWSVCISGNALSVQYKVDKELCKTEEELAEYIKHNVMF